MLTWTLLMSLCVLCTVQSNAGNFAGNVWNKYKHYLELPAVERFREYIRIDTSKEENLKKAVEFLARQADEMGLPCEVYSPAGKPIFVASLQGSDRNLPSIMLNSHMDVVKVDKNEWSHPPFEAFMDENGDIYGRGTQDTKDVGIQYLEAIRKIKKNNITLARTIHYTVMPDEETGGKSGMKAFVKTKEFKEMHVGFALDDGLTTSGDTLFASYVDKRAWLMEFEIHGVDGNDSSMPEGSALDNLYAFLKAIMAYRDIQKQSINQHKTKSRRTESSKYTSVNINVIEGGLAENVIPSRFKVVVDMRLAIDADPLEMEAIVQSWMIEAGNDTKVAYIRRDKKSEKTSLNDTTPYWVAMRNTLNDIGVKFMPIVLPVTSDMVVLRNLGIPAIGFSTKSNTIPRRHANDEYLNVETFIKGIDIYTELIKSLGNMPPTHDHDKTVTSVEGGSCNLK